METVGMEEEEGTSKGGADGGFIGVGEPKEPSMHCGFYGVSGSCISGSDGEG